MTALGNSPKVNGWTLAPVVTGLDFPTSLVFAPDGRCFVAESGLPFAEAKPGGRVWQVSANGERRLVADGFPPPLNGLSWHDGGLIVASLGQLDRLDPDSTRTLILDGLPTGGNYHTNMAVAGSDGWLYFGQGAITNTGVVGLDAIELAWQRRITPAYDIPGYAVTLTGVEAETPNPLSDDKQARARTGAFVAFGAPGRAGLRISAGLPCTAAVMRVRPDGTGLELVAWGLRNAFGVGFLPDGRLLAVDQGADDRGSRPLGNVPDLLFSVTPGAWYGWPDFIGGDPVTDPRYLPERGPRPAFVLANHAALPLPQKPLYRFRSHVAATKFAVLPQAAKSGQTRIAIALFGDEKPMTAPAGPPIGRSVAILSLDRGPLEVLPVDGLVRPIDVAFHPEDGSLHILDFGHFEMLAGGGLAATAGSGTLWRAVPRQEDSP